MESRKLGDFDDKKIIDIDIGRIIDDHLDEEARPKKIGAYYPSEIGMCIRRSYYSYISPKPTEPGALRIFALGNNLHAFIADVLKKSDEFSFVEDEKPIRIPYKDEKTSFTIYGRIDDFVITKNTNKKIIIEAKSVGDVTKVNEPETKHIMQLMLYLSAMEADYGMLLYADKKNLDIRQFRVDYDNTVYNKIITRFRDLDFHLRNKKLPPAEYYFDAKKVWECKYCPYFNDCMQAIANND